MSDEALENSTPSDAHVPWDSIGGSDESIESLTGQENPEPQQGSEEEPESPLTPWAEYSAAPDPDPTRALLNADCGVLIESSENSPSISNQQSAMGNAYTTREFDEQPPRGGGWTIPMLCAGIALIACCVLIPQADANRRLAYEKETLTRDLQSLEQQIDVNREFLKKVSDDPTLAQRLAERQMKVIPQGEHVIDLTHEPLGMSPFQLLNVAPPAPLPPYRPVGGTLARICYGPHSRLYLIGLSLGMIATGLVLGAAPSSGKQ